MGMVFLFGVMKMFWNSQWWCLHTSLFFNWIYVYIYIYIFFFFLPHCVACGILVPWSGIEPWPLAVKVPSPNHWTTRESPCMLPFPAPGSTVWVEQETLEGDWRERPWYFLPSLSSSSNILLQWLHLPAVPVPTQWPQTVGSGNHLFPLCPLSWEWWHLFFLN